MAEIVSREIECNANYRELMAYFPFPYTVTLGSSE
jgi:hypothetical protein